MFPSLPNQISQHLPPRSVSVLSQLRVDVWVGIVSVGAQGVQPITPKTEPQMTPKQL